MPAHMPAQTSTLWSKPARPVASIDIDTLPGCSSTFLSRRPSMITLRQCPRTCPLDHVKSVASLPATLLPASLIGGLQKTYLPERNNLTTTNSYSRFDRPDPAYSHGRCRAVLGRSTQARIERAHSVGRRALFAPLQLFHKQFLE